jgi:hypothetical protein
MSTKPVINKSTKLVSPSISSLLGVVQVMPGESEEVYERGLLATIEELGAQTPLQAYLAEKIFECLWWMRRYETQKRAALIHEMARLLDPTPRPGGQMPAWVITAMEAMLANRVDEGLAKALERGNRSMESLRERAFSNKRDYLVTLDEQVALKAKTLAGFQASYEVLVNRKLNVERMQLNNELLRRDLRAVELEAPKHDQPKKAPGK